LGGAEHITNNLLLPLTPTIIFPAVSWILQNVQRCSGNSKTGTKISKEKDRPTADLSCCAGCFGS